MDVVLFDDYELLDVYGPLELFGAGVGSLPGKPYRRCINLVFASVAETKTATPHGGPTTLADRWLYDTGVGSPADVVFVPGGLGTRALAKDAKFLARLRELAASATLVLSVCTGSLLLGAAGVLDGRAATTNKLAYSSVVDACPRVDWRPKARWVKDGPFYTSSGVSAGTDMAHSFLKELVGERSARLVAKLAEYLPNEDADEDPFAAGTLPLPHVAITASSKPGRTLRVGVVIYDQFEMMDTFGPLEMFGAAARILEAAGLPRAFKVTTLAEERKVQSFRGRRACHVPSI